VLDSYCECAAFDPLDMAERLTDWYRYNPGIADAQTGEALRRLAEGYTFERASRDAWAALSPRRRQNAACLLRAAPTGLLRYHDDARLVGESRVVCGLTHHDETCKLACSVLNLAIAHLLMVGTDGLVEELLIFAAPRHAGLTDALRAVASLQPRDLRGGGVVEELQSALWATIYPDEMDEALGLLLAREGHDRTACALAAALLGARLGAEAIPADWIAELSCRARIETAGARLYELAMKE
jgi:ADP-ribosylglycohydrolase